MSDPVIVQSILVETVSETATVIAETIEAKQESGEIDESALTSDELAAIIELKQDVDVVSQVGISDEQSAQLSSIAETTAAVNEQTEIIIEAAGASVLADSESADALSDILEETIAASEALVEGAIDIETFAEVVDVEELIAEEEAY